MTSRVLTLVTEADVPELRENPIPMPHLAYGLIALAVFMAMLGVLWTFRNTAAKISEQGTDGGSHAGTSAHSGGSGH